MIQHLGKMQKVQLVRRSYWMSLVLTSIFTFMACGGEVAYVPKPRIFPKVEFPDKSYVLTESKDLHGAFALPTYAKLLLDSQNGKPNPGWVNILYTPFNATLHLTHYGFKDWILYDSLVEDTRRLAYKHLQRAEDIEEVPTTAIGSKHWGLIYRIKGNTATNLNFFLTDSARNFIRGALYFNQKTSPDSIAPVFEFVEKDIEEMIKTFDWK